MRGNEMLTVTLPGFRLSPQQARLWALQAEPSRHRAQGVIALEGPLDRTALARAMERVVERHEILRTRFLRRPGFRLPLQVIAEAGQPVWDEAGAMEGAEALARVLDEHARHGADLQAGSPLRLMLIRQSAEKHLLLVTLPALAADARSLSNLMAEAAACYEAVLEGRPGGDDEEVVQYLQFSEWQNELLEDEESAEGRAYWTSRNLAEIPPVVLPFERAGAPQEGGDPARLSLPVDADLSLRIEEASRCGGVDPGVFWLACWQTLLWRQSGQAELTVRVTFDGRRFPELRDSLGLFTRSLPVFVRLGGGFRFSELLGRSAAALEEVGAWQDAFPGEGPDLSLAAEAASVAFAWEDWPERRVAGGLIFRLVERAVWAEPRKLGLTCSRRPEGLTLELAWDRSRFAPEFVASLARQLRSLAAAASPDAPLESLALLAPEDRRILVEEVNATASVLPPVSGVHELFEARAAAAPEAPALVCEAERLSYAELNHRANQLAHVLRALGVGPEVPVALCLERSADLVVALLGVLKAGGAYVPFDPSLPPQRLAFLLRETGAPVVVTWESLLPRLAEAPQVRAVCLDRDRGLLDREPASDPPRRSDLGHLAYVLFTSGSTGQPKGVAVEHRQLLNYVHGVTGVLQLPADASFGLVSTVAADLGNTALFPSLCGGGCLHVISPERSMNPEAFAAYGSLDAIDCLKIVPSHLRALLLAADARNVLPRRLLVLGGEAAGWDLIDRIAELALGIRILNHYGPTETTVGVLTFPVQPQAARCTAHPPLGTPLANSRVYLRDALGELAPPGVPGEVCIGGAGLARGYLGRPDLTADRFVPDPWSGEPGARLYRTGDLGRSLPDGAVDFLGRADHQVKIRGFRVELGEVEAALRQHAAVREAVVVLRSGSGDLRLVAYIVAEGALPGPGELREFLAAKLPEPMLPSVFVGLDALPLTPNGKVDRRALPAPDQVRPAAGGYVAPRTPVEEILASIWAEILRADLIGVHDDFFDLGGHSLLGTQLVSRIRRSFWIELPLRHLFETPTVAGLAARIELLLHAGRYEEVPPIPRVQRERDLPLSFSQEGIWLGHHFAPESAAYNVPGAARFTGPLHVAALEASLRELLCRHEVLRTSFTEVEGRAVQRVQPVAPCVLPLIDLTGLSAPARELEAYRIVRAQARLPFELSLPPLLRTGLVRIAEDGHIVFLTLHHIVSDAWSREILFRELGACYGAFAAGERPILPDLPVQYADYACWQRERLQGDVLERLLEYWTRHLQGAPETLRLPLDRPEEYRSDRGGTVGLQLTPELSVALQRLCRTEDTTPFILILATLQILLGIYSGQDDLVVGIDTANRLRPEIEGLIGCFINNLVLRNDLSGNPSLYEVLRWVRGTTLEAYAHQELPFERLLHALRPRRRPGQTPLFQVLLAFQNTARWERGLPGLTMTRVPVDSGAAKWDLTLFIGDQGEMMSGVWSYRTDLFDVATIERISRSYLRLLELIAASPDVALSQLDLLDAAERSQILASLASTARMFPRRRTVQEAFEEHAALSPGDVAVVCEDGSLTYGELDRRANRWAHHLQSLGVGPDVRVALCLERSLDMVIALLAVLKAGGAYVPLDLSSPRDRLAALLEDAGARLLITASRWQDRIPAGNVRQVLTDLDGEALQGGAERRPDCAAEPASLAYVLFTSGSTGRPKGVAVEHRQIVNYVQAVLERLDLPRGASYATVSTFAADLGNTAVFPALCSGGTLHVISAERSSDPGAMADYFRRHPIDCLKIVPSHFGALVAAGGIEDLLPRRRLVLGGEAAPPSLVGRLRAAAAGRVLNHYGPTEATVGALTYALEPDRVGASLPLGRPLANLQAYVLSPGLALMPVGAPGELCLGGEGLARGYIGRPDLTAERFVPSPFGGEPGARLYQTGDLVRLRPEGNLEFLGRVDTQVKLRGFRIELGEIEAALLRHPGVREAVVVAREPEEGDRRLVGYVVGRSGGGPAVDSLRSFLAERLPDYMVPSAFVALKVLPRTPNGKIDRRALPAPEGARPVRDAAPTVPGTRLEETLAGIWAQVLKVDRVGIHDNFFELGGDSILMIQVIARAGRAGLRFTPRQFTENQTIAALAATLQAGGGHLLEEGPVSGRAPLSPNQLWFFAQGFVEPHHWNQAHLLEVRSVLAPVLLARALDHLVGHHDALRLRFHFETGGWVQTHAAPGEGRAALCIDLSTLSMDRQSQLVEIVAAQVQPSLDLASGPLLRVVYLDFGPERPGRLLLVGHQLIIDGFGWRVLVEDLAAAYGQLAAGDEISLAPRTTSFKRWCELLAESVRSGTLQRDLDAWLALPIPEPHPLPAELPGGENLFGAVRVVSDWLGEAETSTLLQRVPSAYRTRIDDVLLTALVQTFAAWTGTASLLIDLQAHGRDDIVPGLDLSRTVGWFTTCFPVWLSLEQPDEPGESLKSIKEQLRRLPERSIGFRALRFLSAEPRAMQKLRSLPLPEVRFNYQGQFDQVLSEATLFAPAHEPTGLARSPRSRRSHLFDVHGRIMGGRLQVLWRYNETLHRRSTVEALIARYMEHLRALIDHCVNVEEGSFTPSDFPLAGLDQSALEKLARKIGQAKG